MVQDTHNLTHHATVPLTIRGERFGLLNVGSPGKSHFSNEELALLESVAYQIGTAVERTRLYEQKKNQAVYDIARYIVDYFANTNEVTRSIWIINDLNELLSTVVKQIGAHFGWSTVAVVIRQGERLTMRAFYHNGTAKLMHESVRLPNGSDVPDLIGEAYLKQQVCQNDGLLLFPSLSSPKHQYSIAIPLQVHETGSSYEPTGVLLIGRETEPYNELEIKILKVLADHIALAMEKIRLYEERQELLLTEERNRLARDLHDSVNQKLFSLSLTARGMKEIMKDGNELITEGLNDLQQLSKEALSEMRALIWQLRPQDLDKGIVDSLQAYGERLGLHVTFRSNEDIHFPKETEEGLWRIGQEALNNVSRHAGTNRVLIKLEIVRGAVKMTVSDQGCGFVPDQAGNQVRSLGITSMKERAAQINGSLEISSSEGRGTTISVTVPAAQGREGTNDEH